MPGGFLGAIYGQVRLDIRQAVAGYAALRAENAKTLYALRGTSEAFTAAGRSMQKAGLGLVAVFGLAVGAAASFEKKMDFFQAVTDSNAKTMDKLRDAILDMSTKSVFSAGEIADGFVELGKAGVNAKDILEGVGQAVINLGAAGDIPLAESGQILTSIIQTFNLAASDATDVANKLAGAANASIVDITDLGFSFKYAGGVANALGISFDSVTTALSLLGKAGIRGSTAGTSLRQIMVSLSGATGPATDALKELGIITEDGSNKFFDAQGNAKQLSQVFQILQNATNGLTKEQKLAYLRQIFNNRALASAAILTGKGAKGFREMAREINKVTASEVAHKRLDNLSGDLKKLKSNVEAVFIRGGTPLQAQLRNWVQGLTNLVKAFGKLDPETQATIFKILGFVGAALLIIGTVSRIIGMILTFVARMKEVGLAFKFLVRLIPGVVTGVEGLAAVLGITVGAAAAIVIGIILALAAAFVLAWHYSQTFRDAVRATGKVLLAAAKWIGQALVAIGKWFQLLWKDPGAAWEQLKKVTWEAIQAIGSWIKNDLPGLMLEGLKLAGKALEWFAGFVWDQLKKLPGLAARGISALASIIWDQLKKLPGLAKQGMALLGQVILAGLGKLAGLAGRGLKAFAKAVLNELKALPRQVGFLIGFMVGRVIRWIVLLHVKAARLMARVALGIIHAVIKLPGQIARLFVAVAKGVFHGISTAIGYAVHNGPRIASSLINAVIHLPGKIWGILTAMGRKLLDIIPIAAGYALNIGEAILQGIGGILADLPGLVWDAINNAISAFKDMVGAAFNAAKDFAGGLWDGFKAGLGINSPSYIERQAWQMTGVLHEEAKKWGKQVKYIQGLSKTLANQKIQAPKWQDRHNFGNVIGAQLRTRDARRGIGDQFAMTPRLRDRQAAQGNTTITKEYNFDIKSINPKKEKTSDGVQRTLTKIRLMGLLDSLGEDN